MGPARASGVRPRPGGALLVSGWLTDGFRDDRQLLDARDRSREQVERYLADVDPDDEPIGVERTVAVRTARAALWGRVDRIDDRPGEGIVVVDYKTGRSVLTVDDARTSLALAVYAAAAARTLRRPCTRVELHHLPTGDVVAWEHTEESLAGTCSGPTPWPPSSRGLDERYKAGMSAGRGRRGLPGPGGAAVRLVRLPVRVRGRRRRCRRSRPGPASPGPVPGSATCGPGPGTGLQAGRACSARRR